MTDEALRNKLARAEARVAILEHMIEEKTRELYLANDELRESHNKLSELYRVIPGALVVFSPDGIIQEVNNAVLELLGYSDGELRQRHISQVMRETRSFDRADRYESEWLTQQGTKVPVMVSTALLFDDEERVRSIVCVALDISARKRLELELRHAQKMEAIGQLAAGIAHEINTPMQFIGDNVNFLRTAVSDVLTFIEAYDRIFGGLPANGDLTGQLEQAREDADIEFIRERAPRAIERTLVGISRVSTIVGALKAFAHPSNEKAPVDLNRAVENALTLSTNEYKYVADVDVQPGELPLVRCNAGEINQVLVNLIVNAAHAIGDKIKGDTSARGRITVRTYCDGPDVVLEVADTGGGIPEAIRHRVYDPFFTTKEVGRGTGQGLAIAHNIIVEKERGSLTFNSVVGQGTTFYVRLPIVSQSAPAGEAA